MKTRLSTFFSIGYTCQVAWQLKRLDLRYCSGPFDWIITPLPSVIKAIRERFVGFANPLTMQEQNKQLWPGFLTLRDPEYDILSVHDISIKNDPKAQEEERNKFSTTIIRRAERFLNLIEESDFLILIRNGGKCDLKTLHTLSEIIECIRKGKDFIIIVINQNEIGRMQIGPHIVAHRNTKIVRPYSNTDWWKGDDGFWDKVLYEYVTS